MILPNSRTRTGSMRKLIELGHEQGHIAGNGSSSAEMNRRELYRPPGIVALIAACERDPYVARKGGYMPGDPYHHRSGLYPGMRVNQAGA
jgi:hypothetical protein